MIWSADTLLSESDVGNEISGLIEVDTLFPDGLAGPFRLLSSGSTEVIIPSASRLAEFRTLLCCDVVEVDTLLLPGVTGVETLFPSDPTEVLALLSSGLIDVEALLPSGL